MIDIYDFVIVIVVVYRLHLYITISIWIILKLYSCQVSMNFFLAYLHELYSLPWKSTTSNHLFLGLRFQLHVLRYLKHSLCYTWIAILSIGIIRHCAGSNMHARRTFPSRYFFLTVLSFQFLLILFPFVICILDYGEVWGLELIYSFLGWQLGATVVLQTLWYHQLPVSC